MLLDCLIVVHSTYIYYTCIDFLEEESICSQDRGRGMGVREFRVDTFSEGYQNNFEGCLH